MAKQHEEEKVEQVEAAAVNDLYADADADDAGPGNHLSDADIQKQERVTILLHNSPGVDGNKAVFVAAQGFAVTIPRNKKVSIPLGILYALEDAVETHYYREESEGKTLGPILSIDVPRFPFTLYQ